MPVDILEDEINEKISSWHIPLHSNKQWTLEKALKTMEGFSLAPQDVPFIIQLVENPKYDIGLFSGNTTLRAHDCIHILLGRGLLLKDEAFVIGYTMGSTKKKARWRRILFMFISKYLYPEGYKFGEEERYIFNTAVLLGQNCPTDLSTVNFDNKEILSMNLNDLRSKIGLDKKKITRYYNLEGCLFNDRESTRLL